jgi:hypothetical protein
MKTKGRNSQLNTSSRFQARRGATALALIWILLVGSTATLAWSRPTFAPRLSSELSATEKQLADEIKPEVIREVVTALSADEMQGRGTAQPGGDKAANYIADRFAKLNLKPLGDKNSFLQSIKFKETQPLVESSFQIGEQTLKLGSDFVPVPPANGDENASGQMFFIAYGMVLPALKRNDVEGLNLKGKIVVMLEGPPANVSKSSWKKVHAQTDILIGLVGAGVAGVVFVSHGREEHPYTEMADYLVRRQLARADDTDYPAELPPFVAVSDEAADRLFAKAGTTRSDALARAENEGFKPIDLHQTSKITIRYRKGKGSGSNVIGLMEGSDPNLKNEAVVFSAHYDAYGMTADNRIYHGAADNGLGVAEMIAVAEAFSRAAKPKRSIIFMAVTGEEYGGLGSDYWVKNPTWKIKQTAANLNLDGMGTEVYGPVKVIVGFGAEHSSLGNTLSEVAAAKGLKIIPDPMPDEKAFYRSDHYFFVKKGIPGIMLLGAPEGETKAWTDRMKKWEKTDYHQPTDTIRPEWNWEGPRTIAEVMAIMGLRVANDEKMPAWVSSSPFNRERGTNAEPPAEP